MDKLVTAETIDGGQLREAATLKGDERILLKIHGKDCVALEVKYHRRCYQAYTSVVRPLDVEAGEGTSRSTRLYVKSFIVFGEQFIRRKVILQEGIFYMSKVKDAFVETVREVERLDASNYKTSRLKQRLQEEFPQLAFHAPAQKKKSEIVYSNALKTDSIVEGAVQSSSTGTDSEFEPHATRATPLNATLQELYTAALMLKKELNSKKNVR